MRIYERMKATLREFHDRSKTTLCEFSYTEMRKLILILFNFGFLDDPS